MTVQDDLQIVAEWVALSSSMIASGESLSEISVGTRQRVFAALARLESRLEKADRLAKALREIEQMERWAIPPFGAINVARAALADWDGDTT